MKKRLLVALLIIVLSFYIKFGTADNWDGKTFNEIFLGVDPSIRAKKSQEAFQAHAKPFKLTVYYPTGSEQTVYVQPYSTSNVNEYPNLRLWQPHRLLSGGGQIELICDNYDLKIDGVVIESYSPLVTGLSRFKITYP